VPLGRRSISQEPTLFIDLPSSELDTSLISDESDHISASITDIFSREAAVCTLIDAGQRRWTKPELTSSNPYLDSGSVMTPSSPKYDVVNSLTHGRCCESVN